MVLIILVSLVCSSNMIYCWSRNIIASILTKQVLITFSSTIRALICSFE